MEREFVIKLLRNKGILTSEQLQNCVKAQNIWQFLEKQCRIPPSKLQHLRQEINIILKAIPSQNKIPSVDENSLLTSKTQIPNSKLPKNSPKIPISCPSCQEKIPLYPAIIQQKKPIACPHCSHILSVPEWQKELQIHAPYILLNPINSQPNSTTKSSSPTPQLPLENLPNATTIEGYKILRKLGRGSFGITYEAIQITMKRRVALKIILPHLTQHPQLLQELSQNLTALASLHSPNIVSLIDKKDKPFLFYVMPYQERGNLRATLSNQQWSMEQIQELMIKIAVSLQNLHQKNLVHKGLHPANIFLGEEDEVIFSDFGLSTLKTHHQDNYIPPELKQPHHHPNVQSDIYSLGAIFLKLLNCIDSQLVNKNIIHSLQQIIYRMMAPSPQRRYPNLEEVLLDLTQLSLLPPPSTPSTPQKQQNNHTLTTLILTTLIALSMLLMGWALLQLL
ncbi:MAG: serine/threonine protein kinase [Planctomycetota bacterium]|nr:MAG: serine/threonine protein kinase [Planctomycetota bacterium]